jgi:hypothetical protein
MGIDAHIVNDLVRVQEAILTPENRRRTGNRPRRSVSRIAQLRAASL